MRLARALAIAAWAGTLALPAIAPAGMSQALMAEICSADGTRTAPLEHRDGDHAAECPCCTSSGATALPTPGLVAAATVDRTGSAVHRPATVHAAGGPRLPPACGPPA